MKIHPSVGCEQTSRCRTHTNTRTSTPTPSLTPPPRYNSRMSVFPSAHQYRGINCDFTTHACGHSQTKWWQTNRKERKSKEKKLEQVNFDGDAKIIDKLPRKKNKNRRSVPL